MSTVKLKKFLLRYYPPGIILQYERDGVMKQKPVDLLELGPGADIEVQRHTRMHAAMLAHRQTHMCALCMHPLAPHTHIQAPLTADVARIHARAGPVLPGHPPGASNKREQAPSAAPAHGAFAGEDGGDAAPQLLTVQGEACIN